MYIMRAQKTLLIVTLARRVLVTNHSPLSMLRVYIRGYLFITVTICDYKTNSKQQFRSHIKGHGSKEEQKLQKTHKCPNCEKGFFTNALPMKYKKLNVDFRGATG